VNEQNVQAVGFYLHMGFEIVARSELDGTGKPYPQPDETQRLHQGNRAAWNEAATAVTAIQAAPIARMQTKDVTMKKAPFVPDTFEVPPFLETNHFRLRMLSTDDVEKDYAAVIESRDLLHSMGSSWPREGLTIEENLADLERHQQEFSERKAFAYTVVSLDESRVLGCVYIDPAESDAAEAKVFMWVRKSEYDKGLDPVLFQAVKKWIGSSWPFTIVLFPGRESL
jgi:hypothetical protein